MAFSASYNNPAAPGTGSAVSNREDLTNILTQLAPKETPLLSISPKTKARATLHEWTVDELADPDHSGLHEGEDATSFDDKFENRARLGNYTQGFRRDWMVSQVQNAVESVGPAGVAAARIKSMRELKRDIEAALQSDSDRQAGSGAAKYQLRGFNRWLTVGGPPDVPLQYQIPADQVIEGALSEDNLQDMLYSMYNVSGDNSNVTMIADTAVRKAMSNFMRMSGDTNNHRYNVSGTDKKVTLSVDMFESDTGTVRVVNSNPDCSVDPIFHDRAVVINTQYLGVAELIPIKSVDLENQGGGERGYVECWLTNQCRDPRAHGRIDLQAT